MFCIICFIIAIIICLFLGFKFQFSSPFISSQGILAPHRGEKEAIEQEAVSSDELLEDGETFEASPESVPDTFDKNLVEGKNLYFNN